MRHPAALTEALAEAKRPPPPSDGKCRDDPFVSPTSSRFLFLFVTIFQLKKQFSDGNPLIELMDNVYERGFISHKLWSKVKGSPAPRLKT